MRYLILIICCCLILIFALLLHQNFIKEDYQIKNRCIMTYMWRRMFFMDIGLEHPRYSLFLYGEGFYAQKFGSTGILNGIPILFVPGNGGSGRQVRSIGSLLQNKTERMGTSFHFDTFTLDFNEELTALDSEYIHSQFEFLLIAIDWIWSLYEKRPPAGIVLIGHSMGGIIIQAAIMNEKFNKEKVSFILTFATPYSEAPIYFDKNFYNFWEKMHKINPIKKIISISGGLKDEFIEEIWTNSTAVAVHSFTSSIDRVWLDMDHQCILWCNQLVRQTSRLLFDFALDPKAFLGNFQEFAYRHYESIGFQLKPLNENNLIKMDEKSQFILLISPIGNEPIEELINFNKCGQIHEITRYLDANYLFTFLNLTNLTLGECEAKIRKNVKFWMLTEEEIFKPKLELNFQHKFTMQFSMQNSPFGIIPLNFAGENFLIYQIKINRMKCKNELPHRIFFMENGRIRRANEINENGQFSTMLIYSNNAIENEYKLIIIDPNKCDKYSMQFSIHFRLTFIKALRYNRHILPFSIALIFIYYSMPIKTILLNTFSIVLIAFLIQNTSEPLRIAFILLFDAIFFILAYLICILLIRPILNKFSNRISPKVSTKSLIWNLFIIFIAFFTGNSSIPAIFLAFKNIKFFNNLFENDLKFMSMVGLQFCSFIIQIPSIWAHIWNLMKYGEWNTNSDPFFESNLTLMIFTIFLDFIFLIKISHPKFYSKIYYFSNLILFIFVIFIFNRNSACIFIMDDLSLLINLFLIHKIIYQMKNLNVINIIY